MGRVKPKYETSTIVFLVVLAALLLGSLTMVCVSPGLWNAP